MDQHKYLNRVCVFCYKTVDKNIQLDEQDVFQKVKRFCKFLGRLSSKPWKVPVDVDHRFETCADCFKIVNSFNELYHQVQCLQLQLDWKLQKLRNVMRFADKIPSRLKAFEYRYNNISVLKHDDSKDKKTLKEIRSQIKSQVINYNFNASPRVQLQKNTCSVVSLLNHSEIKGSYEITSFYYNFILGWVTTFVAVAECSFPSNNYYYGLCKSLFPASITSEMSQQSEKSSCLIEVSPIPADSNNVTDSMQCDDSVLSLPNSSTEYFDIASPESPEFDPCHQTDTCGNNDKNEQRTFQHFTSANSNNVPATSETKECAGPILINLHTSSEQFDNSSPEPLEPDPCHQLDNSDENNQKIEIDPSITVPSESTLTGPVPNHEQIPPNNSYLIQHAPSSSIENVSIASDHFTATPVDPIVIYAPLQSNAHFQRGSIPTQVPNVEPFQQFLAANITEKTYHEIITSQLLRNDGSALSFENEVPSTFRQLRAKFKYDNCNQTFSSLARLYSHKTSCIRQELNESDQEEYETTALRNTKNDSNWEIPPHRFESDKERDQFIKEDSVSEVSSMEDETSSEEDISQNDIKYEKQKNQRPSTKQCTYNSYRAYDNLLFRQPQQINHQTNKTMDELTEIYKNTNGQVELTEESVISLKLTGADIKLKDSEFSVQVCDVGGCEPSLFSNDEFKNHQRLHGHFKCSFCEYNSNFAPTLITHELSHCSDQQYIFCPKCTVPRRLYKLYYKEHFLKFHLQLEQSVALSPGRCLVCSISFREDQVPLTHFVNAHDLSRLNNPETAYNCEERNCSAYFLTRKQAVEHEYKIHKNRKRFRNGKLIGQLPFQCVFCPVKFRLLSQLKQHKKELHHRSRIPETVNVDGILILQRIKLLIEKRNAKFHCLVDKCEGKYFSQEELDTHSKLHSTFKCQFCSVEKSWAFDLALHELDHGSKQDRDFKCQRCSFSSICRPNYLVHHLETHLKVSQDKIKCPLCEKTFDDLGDKYKDVHLLKIAIRDHYRNYHNKCESVEELTEMYKESNGQVELSDASVKLLKITPAKILLNDFEIPLEVCNLEGCEPGLYTSDDLEYHKNLHGNFKCSFCEFRCSFVPALVSHELEHVTHQPDFSCPKCNDVKIDKIDYKKHFVEQHLNVKFRSAKCPICFIPFLENDQVPLLHFINEHDLSRLKDPEKVEMCNEEGCSAYFLTRKQLIGHSQIVHNKTKKFSSGGKLVECLYTCNVCQMQFAKAPTLNRHLRVVHRKCKTVQSSVGDAVISPDGMTVNDFLTKRNATFRCPEENCEEKYFTEGERDSHVKLHGSFKCEFCLNIIAFAPDLAIHELEHTKEEKSGPFPSRITYKCGRCSFDSQFEYKYILHHLEKHLNVSPDKLKCHICQVVFHSKCNISKRRKGLKVLAHYLMQHDTSELEDKTAVFNCAHCPAYFLGGHQLELHNIRVHPQQSMANLSLGCVDCNRQFPNRKFVLSHRLKVHHNHDESKYQFVCKVTNCQKRFEYKVDLDRHSGWHSTNHYSPKACPECGKIILDKQGFVRHVRSHRGHVCEQCGKKFRTKKSLAIHLLSHSGPDSWEFECEVCSKKCISKEKLEEHMRVHTKVKPFICETCGATYAHRHNWRHHMINKHGVKDFTRKVTKKT